jgi:hypothetical protein
MSNPDMNIHLLNLVKQYKSDCLTTIRAYKQDIVIAEEEKDEIRKNAVIENTKERISHWQITLLQINEVLKECERK